MPGYDPVAEADQVQLLVADEIARGQWADDQLADPETAIGWDDAEPAARKGYLVRAMATAGRLRALGLLADIVPTPARRHADQLRRINPTGTRKPLAGATISMRDTARSDPLLTVSTTTIEVEDNGRRWIARGLDISADVEGVTVQQTRDGGYVAVINRDGHVTEHALEETST